jgi:hypothetical protein
MLYRQNQLRYLLLYFFFFYYYLVVMCARIISPCIHTIV